MWVIGRELIFIERVSGVEIIDVDGNMYVDYVCSWGPLIHGHAHPAVLEVVVEVELVETVSVCMSVVDMLWMMFFGMEASMSAIRLVWAATGRDKLLKFAGAYHGHVDGLLV